MIEAFRHDAGSVYHIVKRCLLECPAFVNGSAEHTRCCSKEACNDVISIGITQLFTSRRRLTASTSALGRRAKTNAGRVTLEEIDRRRQTADGQKDGH